MGPREETYLVPVLDLLRLFSPGCKWLASWIVGGWEPGADAENRNQSRRGVMGGPPYASTTSEAGRHTGLHPWYHLGHVDPVTTEAGQTCREARWGGGSVFLRWRTPGGIWLCFCSIALVPINAAMA